tara:strand:+ start:130 stop:402 length:273 start_codon:yes stop_codon:yes gene_type:complete
VTETEEVTFDDEGNPVSLNSRGVTPIDPVTGAGLFITGKVIGKDGKALLSLTALGEGNRSWHNDRAVKSNNYHIEWDDGQHSHGEVEADG